MDETNTLLTEVQELAWALVDESATEKEVRRLERLLLDNEEARRTYVMCMQMHADLHYLLNPPPPMPAVLQKIIEQEKSPPTKAPLPVVNLPAVDAHVAFANEHT